MNDTLMKHGAFSWSELMTADLGAARQFYGALLGWEFEDFPSDDGESMAYVMVKVDGEAVGGMMALPPHCAGMPPAWGVYVTVDDVDATALQVAALGGKVLRPPEDIPDIGRFCVLQDPQGATFNAITYRKR